MTFLLLHLKWASVFFNHVLFHWCGPWIIIKYIYCSILVHVSWWRSPKHAHCEESGELIWRNQVRNPNPLAAVSMCSQPWISNKITDFLSDPLAQCACCCDSYRLNHGAADSPNEKHPVTRRAAGKHVKVSPERQTLELQRDTRGGRMTVSNPQPSFGFWTERTHHGLRKFLLTGECACLPLLL